MTNYSEQVKSLRYCANPNRNDCRGCVYEPVHRCRELAMMDAAAAIEALQKDLTALQKCYEIADATVDAVLKQLPKRGVWIRIDKHTIQCPLCHRYLDLRGVNAGRGDANYCPNCGADMRAKMEGRE